LPERAMKNDLTAIEADLREHALAFPETAEEFPWGERAIKVRGKTFLFMRGEADQLSLSVKLPESGALALALDFTQPTPYGLGKSGWVTARFEAGAEVPVEILKEWVEESYRAIAPKRLVAQLRRTE
jgi:predicted DNA-binding protein (MmcQ/YjbR family)